MKNILLLAIACNIAGGSSKISSNHVHDAGNATHTTLLNTESQVRTSIQSHEDTEWVALHKTFMSALEQVQLKEADKKRRINKLQKYLEDTMQIYIETYINTFSSVVTGHYHNITECQIQFARGFTVNIDFYTVCNKPDSTEQVDPQDIDRFQQLYFNHSAIMKILQESTKDIATEISTELFNRQYKYVGIKMTPVQAAAMDIENNNILKSITVNIVREIFTGRIVGYINNHERSMDTGFVCTIE